MITGSYMNKNHKDPFAVDPLPKAFYHPSSKKKLSQKARKTALSPDRLGMPEKSDPSDDRFLKKTNTYSTKALPGQDFQSPNDWSTKLDESWPSTERPSSVSIPALDETNPSFLSQSALEMHNSYKDLQQRLFVDKDENTAGKSLLSKYVDRFRNGVPMSRDERTRIGGAVDKDFWWLSSSPPASSATSTPKNMPLTTSKHHMRGTNRYDQRPKPFNQSPSRIDNHTKKLQERADRMIERSESSLRSSGPVVSTEGLGSSPSSTSMSTLDEQPYRPSFTRSHRERNMPLSCEVQFKRASGRPEEDILYQWRLNRKMERAREGTLPTASSKFPREGTVPTSFSKLPEMKQDSSKVSRFDEFQKRLEEPREEFKPSTFLQRANSPQFTPAPSIPDVGLTEKSKVNSEAQTGSSLDEMARHLSPSDELSNDTNPPIASPVLKRKTDPKSHLHLMCDILPCPHQDKYHTNMNFPHDTNDDEPDKKSYRQYLVAERPDIDKQKEDSRYSRVKDKTSSAKSKSQQNRSHKVETKNGSNSAVVFDEETGKSAADSKHDGKKAESGGEKREQRSTFGPGRRGAREAPVPKYSSSPKGPRQKYTVKEAIGEVVSDHLFSSTLTNVTSSVDSWASVSSAGEHPAEHVSKENLASEDEDGFSDGTEFMDDDLLQMLRCKRAEYEEQLRTIDSLLADSLGTS